jgi:cation transport ATPase
VHSRIKTAAAVAARPLAISPPQHQQQPQQHQHQHQQRNTTTTNNATNNNNNNAHLAITPKKTKKVFAGALGALAVMTILSAMLGWAAPNLVPKVYTHYAATALFFFFGFKTLYDALIAGDDVRCCATLLFSLFAVALLSCLFFLCVCVHDGVFVPPTTTIPH